MYLIYLTLMTQLSLFPEWGSLSSIEGDSKVCTKCNQNKPLTAYSKSSGASYLRPECRSCNNELSRVRKDLRITHGMPEEDYTCPICLRSAEEVDGKGGRAGAWVVDHCHSTDKFRGWLCHSCNRGIGYFEDSTNMMQRAIMYLSP